MKRCFVFVCMVLLGLSITTQAEEETLLEEIVVTATKTEQEIEKTGSSITVITRKEIEQSGYETVEEALRNTPGLTVVGSGAFGGTADVSIRGSKNYGHTLVLVDGVVVNDPMSIQRSFDFAHITMDNVERIEIVKGPQSTLYGSDAMAGVINIITRKGKEGRQTDFSLYGGQHSTFGGDIGFSGAKDRFNYSFSLSGLDTDGISKAYGGDEEDGYRNTGFSTNMGYEFPNNAELSINLRYTNTKTDLDAGAFADDPYETSYWKNLTSNVGFKQAVSRYWDYQISLGYSETERKYKNTPAGTDNTYSGDFRKIEWQNNIYPAKNNTITAGVEYQEEQGSSKGLLSGWAVDFPEKDVSNRAFYLQDQIVIANSFYITPGLRIDDNEMFGSETTCKISSSCTIKNTGTRLKANYGTGFKAPTLYQLYDGFSGNINLNPERVTSYDLGFEQELMEDRIFFGLTYFKNRYEDMIDWVATGPYTGEYQNFAEVETSGFEFETRIFPLEKLSLSLNYTYLDTKDKQTGKSLLRRPEHKISLSTNWQVSKKNRINLTAGYVGERDDLYYAGWTPVEVKNDDYVRVDMYHTYQMNDNLNLFVKIENIFDEDYQEIAGYETPGRSFYGGIKGRF
jgi:vitamin B12 transporter